MTLNLKNHLTETNQSQRTPTTQSQNLPSNSELEKKTSEISLYSYGQVIFLFCVLRVHRPQHTYGGEGTIGGVNSLLLPYWSED